MLLAILQIGGMKESRFIDAMAVCNNCGEEGARVRSRWTEKGIALPDECPACAPQSFEKFSAPSDKKIWMGYEAHPNEYEKRYDADGLILVRKPEYRAEQEDRLRNETADERDARLRAEAEKRATRRTDPMTAEEMLHALAKAQEISNWLATSGEA